MLQVCCVAVQLTQKVLRIKGDNRATVRVLAHQGEQLIVAKVQHFTPSKIFWIVTKANKGVFMS